VLSIWSPCWIPTRKLIFRQCTLLDLIAKPFRYDIFFTWRIRCTLLPQRLLRTPPLSLWTSFGIRIPTEFSDTPYKEGLVTLPKKILTSPLSFNFLSVYCCSLIVHEEIYRPWMPYRFFEMSPLHYDCTVLGSCAGAHKLYYLSDTARLDATYE
jgi:hypothetical protein